jgi:hypothetical protein
MARFAHFYAPDAKTGKIDLFMQATEKRPNGKTDKNGKVKTDTVLVGSAVRFASIKVDDKGVVSPELASLLTVEQIKEASQQIARMASAFGKASAIHDGMARAYGSDDRPGFARAVQAIGASRFRLMAGKPNGKPSDKPAGK